QPYREIGSSATSKVFEQPGTPWAFKILIIDQAMKLWNNYTMQMRAYDSFVGVAKVFSRRPRNVLCMERILPLPQAVRDALIDLFGDPTSMMAAKNDPSNADCLVHILLGSK
ncbi:hypothetical protein BO82DRAFT_250300, partial [Aspergillus uvarum CBS 121591]